MANGQVLGAMTKRGQRRRRNSKPRVSSAEGRKARAAIRLLRHTPFISKDSGAAMSSDSGRAQKHHAPGSMNPRKVGR